MRNLIGKELGFTSTVIPMSSNADDLCQSIKGPDVGDYKLTVTDCDGDDIIDQVSLKKSNGSGFLYEQIPPNSGGWREPITRDKSDPYFTFGVYKIKKNGRIVFTDRFVSAYIYQQIWDSF